MEWLLKITEGPAKGAEIALVGGTRVKVGRGDACDIVLADAALDDEAFELDVSDAGVTLIAPGDVVRSLKPFEVHAFGTTSIAVGPAEGAWEALREPAPEAPAEPAAEESAEAASGEAPAAEAASEPEAASASAESAAAAAPVKRRGHGCLFALIAFVLLVAGLLAAAWFFRSRLVERFPALKPWVDRIEAAFSSGHAAPASAEPQQTPAEVSRKALQDLAKQHGLVIGEKDGATVLSGDLAHRTERMAIRALALAADRHCVLDLSDAETLASSAEALLFAVTEGAVTVDGVSKRTVALKGYAPDAVALARVFDAIRADVPWVKEITARRVRVGGPVLPELAKNVFANTGRLAKRPEAKIGAKVAVEKNADGSSAKGDGKDRKQEAAATQPPVQVAATVAAGADRERTQAAALVQVAEASEGRIPTELLPVAGLLVKPYACVVLQNGHRLVEGAKISGLTITAITAACITLEFEGKQVKWEP